MAKFSEFKSRAKSQTVDESQIKQKYDEFKNMSQDQLNQTLLNEVAKQKRNGNFDYQALSSMIDSLQGVLPASDFQNIKRLLESLR